MEDETGNLEMLEEDEDAGNGNDDAGSENAGNDADEEEYVEDDDDDGAAIDQLDLVEMDDLEEQVKIFLTNKLLFLG